MVARVLESRVCGSGFAVWYMPIFKEGGKGLVEGSLLG